MHFRFRAFRRADEANNKHIKVAPHHGNINITLSITFGSALGDHVRIDMFIPKRAICHCLMSCNFPLRSCSYLSRALLVLFPANSQKSTALLGDQQELTPSWTRRVHTAPPTESISTSSFVYSCIVGCRAVLFKE